MQVVAGHFVENFCPIDIDVRLTEISTAAH